MAKMAGGIVLMLGLSVGVMLGWVGGAVAATPISACGFTINAPGTYVLTANLSSPDTNNCITVAANNVAIDFNGFVIDGSGNGASVTDGGTSQKSIALRNGTIRGNKPEGIALGSSTSVIVASMIVSGHGVGVAVGSHSIVKNSTIHDNLSVGVVLGSSSSLTDSTIHNSGVAAVFGGSQVTLARNTFTGTTTTENFVILLGDHAAVLDNAMINNSADISIVSVDRSSVVTRNTALHNSAFLAIGAADDSRVTYNVANANTKLGIAVGPNSDVVGNTAIGNGGDGIRVFCPSTVKFNTAFANGIVNLNELGAGCTNVGNNAP